MSRYLNKLLAIVVMLAVAAPALAAVELSASPTTFSPGAKIKVVAEGLTGSTSYKLRLEPNAGGTKYDLATFNSGLKTTVALAPVIPAAPPGAYTIFLYSGSITLTKVAEVPAKVVGALGVTLNPTTAPPGKAVVVTVTNLFAGSVRVKYAGETILGPVADDGGTWSGKFVVPKDRPASLPATVAVEVENLVGKTIPKAGSASFNAQAISTAPKLTLSVNQSPATKLDRGSAFQLGGTLKTDENKAPNGDQHLYWKGANGVVLPLDTTMAIQNDGSFAMEARAPDWYRDGYHGVDDQPGDLVIVNQGVDLNTDSDSDFKTQSDGPKAVVDGDSGGAATFTLIIKGNEPGPNDPPLANVMVEANPDYRDAFGYAAPPGGGSNNNDEWVLESLSSTQFEDSRGTAYQTTNVSNYGCEATAFRRPTNAEGKVTFTISPDDIRRTNFVAITSQCFTDGLCKKDVETGPPNGGGDPGPGAAPVGTKAGQVEVGDAIAFTMLVRAGPKGYRSTGITLGYIADSKTFVNVETGEAFVNNTGTIVLEKATGEEVDLANWRLEGLGHPQTYTNDGVRSCGVGTCYYSNPYIFGNVFRGEYASQPPSQAMYTFPNASKWPVQVRNTGRKMWLTVHPDQTGLLSSGKVTIQGYPPVYFVAQNAAGCDSGDDQAVQYAAALPDLTEVAAGYLSGTMELTFGAFTAPPKSFVILTQLPPTGIEKTNVRIATLNIDALNDTITGSFKVDSPGIAVPPPGHGIGNMDNKSTNSSSFIFVRTADSQAVNQITSLSNNKVAANPSGDKKAEGQNGGYFGFTDQSHSVPQAVVLFDTGLIPLFRYTWGLEPIAGATLGADFWLASELAYYGRLRTQGMNATIDPTVEGGVDIFFDLDILFGLVSASVTAETTIGLTLRTVVGDGGLPPQTSGSCFSFDLDVTWEACAVGICGGDTIDLITVREPTSNCSVGAKSYLLAQDKLLPDPGAPGASGAFDLARPRPVASALATDGRGTSISLGVTDAGALVATHLSGGIAEFTRTVAAAPVGVQHVDVAFHGSNRAMAVWSENTRTAAQIASLVQTLRGAAFADMVKTQRLRYSYWDGTKWSTPANLTSAGSDGKPRLAGCLASPRFLGSTCPVGGEITAVWERDANANLNAPDLEVWSASWSPGDKTWSTPARVSATGASSDMLPQVAYRNAVPVVAWVNNPDGQFNALTKRRAAFRFLDRSSPAQVATELGSSVGWLSLGVDPDDHVVIAYTQAQDSLGFVGNRQALRVARGTCATGDCTFEVTEPRDPNGRQFRIERPSVMFDEDGTPLIGFRALGFGPDAQNRFGLPGDPPGTLLGTGELATVRVSSFATPTVTAQFRPLTNDGLQHWKPAMVFDDTIDGILAVSRDAAGPAQQTSAMRFVKAFSPKGLEGAAAATALNDGASLRTLDGGPDFTLRDPVLSKRIVSAGQTLTLNLKLVNQGQAYDPAVHGPLKVVASWNAPAGAGTVGGTYNLTQTQAANAQRSLGITVTVPAGVSSDERQTLFIDIVAGEDANAIGGAADQLREVLNAMPVPQDLIVSTRLDSNFVNVTWEGTADTRVHGWRVWRLGLDGTWQHLGATTKPGYMDLFAPVGQEVQYRVASYSDNGMESEPSAPVSGFVRSSNPDAVFANGFEGP